MNIEKTYEIIEKLYDENLNYSGIPKPFLAYALGGAATSVLFFFDIICLNCFILDYSTF